MALTDKTMRLLLSAMGSPEARDELITNIESIDSSEIADGAITTDKLEALAVTNAKVATGLDAAKIGAGAVSNTEFSYLDGVTSAIQTQFTGKQSTTLADASILVGNGSNVATAVVMSGDATLSNAGVLTLAANSVAAAEITDASVTSAKISSSVGVRKMHSFTVGFAALNAAGTGVAALFGTAIPDNAVIVRAFYDVVTSFSGDGDDASTIKLGIEDQDDDVKVAVAISDGSTPYAAGIREGIQVNTAATMVKLSAARQLAVTWTAAGTDTALDAGSMVVFLEYVQSI